MAKSSTKERGAVRATNGAPAIDWRPAGHPLPPQDRQHGGRCMSTLQRDQVLQQRGQNLHDRDGDKIGTIEEIYLDAATNEPEWALVNTGLFGTKSTFVPLREATDEGGS